MSYYAFDPLINPTVPYTPWVWWDNYFTEPELDILQKFALQANEHALTGDQMKTQMRNTLVSWIYPENTEFIWVFKKIEVLIRQINDTYFKFDITGAEPLQLANYKANQNGKYDWHLDGGGPVTRKLTMILQLTDSKDYTGGDLELQEGSKDIRCITKKRGFITVFPSWLLHRVTPVTSGERQSLVCWTTGPSFR